MASFTERQLSRPSPPGVTKLMPILSPPGKHPSSSPTGSGSQRSRKTALSCWKVDWRFSATRPALSCFNCRCNFTPTRIGSSPSAGFYREIATVVLNFATPAGTHPAFCACFGRKTSPCAFPITTMRRRLGSGRRISFISEDMGPAAATGGDIQRLR